MGAQVVEPEAQIGQEVRVLADGADCGRSLTAAPPAAGTVGADGDVGARRPHGRIDERDLECLRSGLRPRRGSRCAGSTLTSRCSKRSPAWTKTWFLPFFSNTAWRGTCSASAASLPSIVTRADDAGLQPRIGLVELERHVEHAGSTLRLPEVARLARPASAPTFAAKLLARQRVDFDRRRLALAEVGAIVLVDLGAHFHPAGLDHVGDRPARARPDRPRGTPAAPCPKKSCRPARRGSPSTETTPSSGALQHQAVDDLLRALHREHAPCCASPRRRPATPGWSPRATSRPLRAAPAAASLPRA